jgi:hypothetical protein
MKFFLFQLLYIDAGSGSILIQMIIAGLASTLVVWSKIKTSLIIFIKRLFKKP